MEPFEVLGAVGGVDGDQPAVLELVEKDIVDDGAVAVEQQAVVGVVEGHLLDIVDLDELEKEVGVGAGQFKLAHMVDIEEAGGVAHGVMFGDGAGGVLDGQFVAGEFDHAAAEGHVGIIQRCTLHASLLCESGCGHRAHGRKNWRRSGVGRQGQYTWGVGGIANGRRLVGVPGGGYNSHRDRAGTRSGE